MILSKFLPFGSKRAYNQLINVLLEVEDPMALFSWQTWLIITIVCGLVELFWYNTYTLCISIAAFLTMLATIFGLVAGAWQAIVFAILAGLALLVNEKLIKPYMTETKGAKNEPEATDNNTKAD